jgi:dipeptidyl aminopeptidase/acylaminoacyl peptidase
LRRSFTARLELTGEAVPIAEDVALGGSSGRNGAFSVSKTGVLAYQTSTGSIRTELVWLDRQGTRVGTLGDRADYMDVELSPDGTRAAVSVLDPARNTRDIWLYDVARGIRTRFTDDPANEVSPVWSPEGAAIVFDSNRKKNADLYQKVSSGVQAEQTILQNGQTERAWSWSRDGRYLLYTIGDGVPTFDLWVLPLFGDQKPFPFLATPFAETRAKFSPDGRWVAYTSNESGRAEVFVAPFPKADAKYRISTGAGSWSRWRPDGKGIFYLTPGDTLMSAEVNGQGPTFAVGAVTPLFKMETRAGGQRYPYDVSPDGQRFLVNTSVEQPESPPITVVVNWTAALRK